MGSLEVLPKSTMKLKKTEREGDSWENENRTPVPGEQTNPLHKAHTEITCLRRQRANEQIGEQIPDESRKIEKIEKDFKCVC